MSDLVEDTIDVSHLPQYGFGRRSAIFWGTLLFTAIETTALAILFAAYLYVRGNFDEWPPSARLELTPGLVATVLMLVSCVPMQLSLLAARKLDLRPTRRWMGLAVVIGALACAARAWEIHALPFRWTENAYASVVWTSYGFHTVELVASVLEGSVMAAVFFIGPVEEKHYEDAEVTGLFWYFANLIWIPFAALFYVDGATR
jgi:cytochrome c oxidase subunit III